MRPTCTSSSLLYTTGRELPVKPVDDSPRPLPALLPDLPWAVSSSRDFFFAGTVSLMLNLRIGRGRCLPLGASSSPEGVNFALLSRHATSVALAVYPVEGKDPLARVTLHPRRNR